MLFSTRSYFSHLSQALGATEDKSHNGRQMSATPPHSNQSIFFTNHSIFLYILQLLVDHLPNCTVAQCNSFSSPRSRPVSSVAQRIPSKNCLRSLIPQISHILSLPHGSQMIGLDCELSSSQRRPAVTCRCFLISLLFQVQRRLDPSLTFHSRTSTTPWTRMNTNQRATNGSAPVRVPTMIMMARSPITATIPDPLAESYTQALHAPRDGEAPAQAPMPALVTTQARTNKCHLSVRMMMSSQPAPAPCDHGRRAISRLLLRTTIVTNCRNPMAMIVVSS